MPPFYVSSFPGQPLDAIVNQIVNILQGATGTLWIDQYVVLGTGAADPPVVIPATVDVRVPIGGWVELGEGTLAIEGPFTAPPVQVFSWAGWLPRPPRQGNPPGPHPKPGHPTFFLNRPSGRVVWGPAVVPSIRPEWYGAWPDGVLDSKFAIQQAIDDAHSSWKKNYFQQTV